MKKSIKLFLISFTIFSFQISVAQSIDETVNNLSQQAGSAYVQPVISAFSSNLNSGWFDSAPSASILGFDLSVKITGSASFFNNDQKSFNSSGGFRFTNSQVDDILSNSGITSSTPGYQSVKDEMLSNEFVVNFSGPTIVGSDQENMIISFPGATIQGQSISATSINLTSVKGLLNDYSALPFGSIQLGLGTIYGTKALVRWFPSVTVQDLGEITFFGWGLMHNANIWFDNALPIDVSFGFFSQTLTVGNVFESTATQYGIYLSKTFGMGISVSPFIGLTNETGTTTVKYDYTFDTPTGASTQSLQFDLEGNNSTALTLGANFKLFILNLAVDYKLAKTNTASASLFFGF